MHRSLALRLQVVALGIISGCPLWAQGSKPLSPMSPDGFQFTGSWDCQGNFGNGKIHRSAFTGSVILGGKWIELSEQDIEPATGYLARYLIGYDPQQKRIIEFDANNFGAATYASKEGWQDHVLTMTSPLSQDTQAPYAANRFLYSITGKDEFTVDWQITKTGNSAWTPGDHLVCKRKAR